MRYLLLFLLLLSTCTIFKHKHKYEFYYSKQEKDGELLVYKCYDDYCTKKYDSFKLYKPDHKYKN